MRLISLTCDQPSFKPILFNYSGITLIVGDSSDDNIGSSNGVGKTLALSLVSHCLGANKNAKLASAVPNWVFSLLISMNGQEYLVSRTGDGSKIVINDKQVSLTYLKELLKDKGGFNIDENLPFIQFRSLFKRFARVDRDDCIHPTKTARQTDYAASLETLYLLGLDCSLVVSKYNSKKKLDEIKTLNDQWKKDSTLQSMFIAGTKPQIRIEFIESEISRLKEDLEAFQVAENYHAIEIDANNLTSEIRTIIKEQAIIEFQIESIRQSLETNPDITRQNLLDLYEGLQNIFKAEALAHFETVENFHNSLTLNRTRRLQNDRLKLQEKWNKLDIQRKKLGNQRDIKLQSLHGKRALDEYIAIARKLASLEEEHLKLSEFLNFSANLEKKAQEIREQKVKEDRFAKEYTDTLPLANIDTQFKDLVQVLYPHTAAGLVLEPNTDNNQLRYNLTVQIDGDASDGINAARILCFDWVIFMYGANHSMDMLWHDNRLFADMDPIPRAAWFSYVHHQLKLSGKQYIATINTENYDAMMEHLLPETKESLEKAVVLRLIGDSADNKLLGISFG